MLVYLSYDIEISHETFIVFLNIAIRNSVKFSKSEDGWNQKVPRRDQKP